VQVSPYNRIEARHPDDNKLQSIEELLSNRDFYLHFVGEMFVDHEGKGVNIDSFRSECIELKPKV
jgi:hypothetical protein